MNQHRYVPSVFKFSRLIRSVLAMLFVVTLLGCDPEGKKNCQWVLEPEPDLIGKVDQGFIPLCARNRVNMKQDCRLQAKVEFAKEVSGRKFRYTDLKVQDVGVPRTITTVTFCDEGRTKEAK